MTEQEKLAFELEIRQKVAEENRAKQRESKARWREKNREYLRACEHYRRKSIRIQNGVADSHRICQYSLDGEFINVYESSSEAAKKLGISDRAIRYCLAGKIKTSAGFKWGYLRNDPIYYPIYGKAISLDPNKKEVNVMARYFKMVEINRDSFIEATGDDLDCLQVVDVCEGIGYIAIADTEEEMIIDLDVFEEE